MRNVNNDALEICRNQMTRLTRLSLATHKWSKSADPHETPHNVASHHGFRCLLKKSFFKLS